MIHESAFYELLDREVSKIWTWSGHIWM